MDCLKRKAELILSSGNKKIVFLFFDSLFSKGGHTGNFFNLIKHVEPEIKKNNYEAYIISYNNIKNKKSKIKNSNSNTNFEKDNYLFLKTYDIKTYKRFFPSGNAVFQLLEYIINFFRTAKFIMIKRPEIVYAYADKPLYLTFPLKKLFTFRLIYDMRGDILDELKTRGTSKGYISGLAKIHSKAVNSADIAFSVNNVNGELKFITKYNYYDGDIFRYDETRMMQKRKEMNLEDKFVFVYTGNMHYYQYLEGIVKFFSRFYEKHKDSYFIIITEHDTSKFRELLNRFNIPDNSFMIKSMAQDEISELQQIADMGFLLREDLPLNHHSFPTKFAEYLASGVPVLMTPHIKTIAPIVKENELGEVIDIKEEYTVEIDKIYSKYKNNLNIKKRCSMYAMSEFMWQNKGKEIFKKIIAA